MTNINSTGVLLRFMFAVLLVLLTYNPSGYSYFHWVWGSDFTPYIAVAGAVLLIGWVIYVRATLESLGTLGLILASAFFACLVWLLVYWGWLSLSNVSAITWVAEVILAALLALGMSWSHIHRRMTGQVDVDELDDN